jgi:hypothetical protein
MSFSPSLVKNDSITSIQLGQTYSLSSLFSYVPGTVSSIIWVAARFVGAPGLTFSNSPGFFGTHDYTLSGTVDMTIPFDDFYSGTVTFNSTASLSVYVQYAHLSDPSDPSSGIIGTGQQFFGWGFTQPIQPLFTANSDSVDFDALSADQKKAVADGANLYAALGGADNVTLPNLANANQAVADNKTLNWNYSVY